jgi:mersacidin/lichenicidin family type 2 lantibiotic
MSNIVRAWKDETYRQSLSTEEQAMLPTNPAGEIELTDAQLAAVYGAADSDGVSDSDGAGDNREGTNDIDQRLNQQTAATYGNKVMGSSVVLCEANNEAEFNAMIDWLNK